MSAILVRKTKWILFCEVISTFIQSFLFFGSTRIFSKFSPRHEAHKGTTLALQVTLCCATPWLRPSWSTSNASVAVIILNPFFIPCFNTKTFLASPTVHRITNWKLSHKTGSIKFVSNSFLVIGTAGYYFVYSQLFYYAGDTLFMGHYTYINEDPVMRSLSSVVSETKKYNTNYQGGVFLLRKGDKISVRIPFTKSYFMNEETSYFGAFLISPEPNVLNTTSVAQSTTTDQDQQ